MQKYKWLIGMMVIALFVAVWPVQAQDGDNGLSEEERQLIETVIVPAYENLSTVNSYQLNFTQETDQLIISGEGLLAVRIGQTIDQSITGRVKVGQGEMPDESALLIEQSMEVRIGDTAPVPAGTELEIRQGVVGEGEDSEFQIWVLPSLIIGPMNQLDTETEETWLNVTENPEILGGFEVLDLDTVTGWNMTQYVTADTIQSVEEIPFEDLRPSELEELNESGLLTATNLRVFNITFDAEQMGQAFNLAELFNPDEVNVDVLLTEMLAGATITHRVYIADLEEGQPIPYRIEATIGIDTDLSENITGAEAMSLEQTVNSITELSAFNEEVVIRLPGYEFGS